VLWRGKTGAYDSRQVLVPTPLAGSSRLLTGARKDVLRPKRDVVEMHAAELL
jgi:hypothetical protein